MKMNMKSLGQAEPGLELSIYEPDPVLNAASSNGLMLVPAPTGYNSTNICMEMSVRDGKVCADCLSIHNYDSDPYGREEAPGSADEAREKQHYATVMSIVAGFLGAGEPAGVVTSKAGASPDEEGEALDDVDEKGKKRNAKEASVEVSFA